MFRMYPRSTTVSFTLVLAVLASPAFGTPQPPRPPEGGAITGVDLVLEGGKTVENGTLVWRSGRIVAAGSANGIAIPADIVPRDGNGLTVYPGLIELLDLRDPRTAEVVGDARPDNLAITSDAMALAADPERNRKLREAGFVASLVASKSGILRGEGLFATLADGPVEPRILLREATQHVALEPASGGGYPASKMGAVAAVRQAFADARWLTDAEAAFALNRAQPRPRWSATGARLRLAAEGRQPVVFEADDAQATLRAAALAKELGLRAWIAGSGQEYRRTAEIRATGLAQILPLRFPEAPKKPGEGDPGPELDELRDWALAPENPARMIATGLPVAFTTFRLDDPLALHAAVATAGKHGLSDTEALRALSATPARLLGLEESWGALAPGRSASFVLVDGALFVDKPKIREVWIEGERFVVGSKSDQATESEAKAEEAKEKAPAAARETSAAAIPMAPGVDPTAAWRSAIPERSGVLLVRGATIWTSGPAGRLENADLLVRDGRIAAIGAGLSAPAGARILDASGRHVTPGLIDAHSHTGIDGAVNEGTHISTAEVRVGDVIDAEDVGFYRQLAGGLTVANLLHGSANAIGGQNAVVKLRWGAPPAGLAFEGAPPGIKFALGENPKQSNWQPKERRFPQTRMGVEQAIRERFLAARDYVAERQEYEALAPRSRAGRIPPRRDFELEAIAEILAGKRLVHAHSYRADEVLMLIALADAFGVRVATFQHILEGYKVADEIARHGAGASGFSDWWAYKYEVIDAIPWNGAILHDRGVLTSFNSDSSELARRMNLEAAKAVRYGGLDEQDALRFVTLNPARQLGIDSRVGSLEVGKDADFVIWSGHPLSNFSVAQETWIEGRKYFDRAADLAARESLERERQARIAALTPEAAPAKVEKGPEVKP